jgi:hypothetical protein
METVYAASQAAEYSLMDYCYWNKIIVETPERLYQLYFFHRFNSE